MKSIISITKVLLVGALLAVSSSCTQKKKPFTFAFVSDTHIGNKTSYEDLARTIKDINTNDDIEFVVVTGDITEFGADSEIIEAKKIYDTINKPWYVVPGNHDANWSESGANTFKNIFGSDHFTFEANGFLFVGTSSGPNMRMAPGLVPHEEVVWLDEVLDPKKIGDTPVIFLNHYPMNEEMANWYLIIDKLKKVNTQGILNGHGHQNKAYDYEGIPGTMGRSNLRAKDEIGGYNLVTVANDTMYFAERTPGVETKEVWRKMELKNHHFENDTTQYPRPSYAINEKYPNVTEKWNMQEDSDVPAGVIANDIFAFYPSSNGNMIARYVENGEKIWEFKTTGKIYSTPALKGNNLVFASTDSTIYNIDPKSGALKWKVPTGKSIVASATIDGDQVFIGSSEGIFRSLSLKTGEILWENKDIVGFVETRPLVDNERVYFGSWGNDFYALNKKTGKPEWIWNSGASSRMLSPATVFPVKANGKVYITAPDRATTSFNARTGKVMQRSNHHKGRESIGVSQDGKHVYIKAMQDTLFAYSTSTNSIEPDWFLDVQFGYEISPSPIVEYGNLIFVPTDKGVIYAINKNTRKTEWAHKISNALINNVFPINEHSLLTTTMDGKVVRLEY